MLTQHYTIQEVSDLLAVNHKTIRNLIHKGMIRAVKIGGVIRIPEDGLTEYLAARLIHKQKKTVAPRPSINPTKIGGVKDYFAA